MFEKYDAERTFNIIDQILIEDALRDNEHDGKLIKARAGLDKAYGRIGRSGENDIDSDDPWDQTGSSPTLAQETENGFVGFEAPLG